ncbi:MAG: NfeD family protein [Pseudomonadota bacterium]
MILDAIARLGGWMWFLVGLVLLIGEVVLPGTMLVWFGLAAIAVGIVTVVPFLGLVWWTWPAQLVAFAVLSLIFALLGQRFLRSRERVDGAATMNQPLQKFVGRQAVLAEPIVAGQGKVKLGDTLWRVEGADMQAGVPVQVTGVRGESLLVEPVADGAGAPVVPPQV